MSALSAPVCRLCGAAHGSRDPHQFAPSKSKPARGKKKAKRAKKRKAAK